MSYLNNLTQQIIYILKNICFKITVELTMNESAFWCTKIKYKLQKYQNTVPINI